MTLLRCRIVAKIVESANRLIVKLYANDTRRISCLLQVLYKFLEKIMFELLTFLLYCAQCAVHLYNLGNIGKNGKN